MCEMAATLLQIGRGGERGKERQGRGGERREGVKEILGLHMSTERKKDLEVCRPLEQLKLCKKGLRRQQIKLLSFANNM